MTEKRQRKNTVGKSYIIMYQLLIMNVFSGHFSIG